MGFKEKIFSLSEDLLDLALTHRSFSKRKNNEQLEFLGDAVLELAVSLMLYLKFPTKKEGELTMLRSNIVNTENLAKIAKKLNLNEKVKVKKVGPDSMSKITVDALEALIGAYFLYFGWEKVYNLLEEIFKKDIEKFSQQPIKNPKNILQEYYQQKKLPLPQYKLIKSFGPEHKKVFVVGIFENDKKVSQAKGYSLKEAEIKAAKKLIKKLKLI